MRVDPVVQVLPEAPLGNSRLQVAVRGRHDAHVHPDGNIRPERLEDPFLQHPEELRLRQQRDLGRLVQKQGPPLAARKRPSRSRLR